MTLVRASLEPLPGSRAREGAFSKGAVLDPLRNFNFTKTRPPTPSLFGTLRDCHFQPPLSIPTSTRPPKMPPLNSLLAGILPGETNGSSSSSSRNKMASAPQTTPKLEEFLKNWRQDALNKHQYDAAIFVGDKLHALTGKPLPRYLPAAHRPDS